QNLLSLYFFPFFRSFIALGCPLNTFSAPTFARVAGQPFFIAHASNANTAQIKRIAFLKG
ncbi:MAG: hypothetical protein ACTHJ5_05175, partial [Ilyomonas sp.]